MEIDTSARRALWGARMPVFNLLFVGFIMVSESGVPRQSYHWLIAMLGFTFGWLCLVAILIELFRRIWRATRPRPQVVIDENGIWDRRGSVGLLKWTDIRHVRRYRNFWLGEGLVIDDPPVGSRGHFRRYWDRFESQLDLDGAFDGFELIVDFDGLSMPIDQAWPRIVEIATSQGWELGEERNVDPYLFGPSSVFK